MIEYRIEEVDVTVADELELDLVDEDFSLEELEDVIEEELDEDVLELVADDVDDEEVEEAPHSPVRDGTASTPFPIATKFVPHAAALARRRF